MSIGTEPARPSLAQAKAALIDAAQAFDPIALIRRRPFISISMAAVVGAGLGMHHGWPVSLTRALTLFMRIDAWEVGKYVVARARHATTKRRDRQGKENDRTECLKSMQLGYIMKETQMRTNAAIEERKTRAGHAADTLSYRTVLSATSEGVRIGLLLRR